MKKGFTLAEVLITLVIIGVVAAMTIPTIMAKYQEKVTVTKLLKTFALVNNAYQMAKIDNGNFVTWFSERSYDPTTDEDGNVIVHAISKENQDILFGKLAPYLKVVSDYKTSDAEGKYDSIFSLTGIERSNANILSQYHVMNLIDGVSLINGTVADFEKCEIKNNYCGDLAVDINGGKSGPNKIGVDIFYFIITRDNISPMGSRFVTGVPRSFPKNCTLNDTTNSANGYACAAWVIENKNMDYLHCSDLSWDGKHRCSD